MAKAVEIERRQANNELEKVRESMKSVLERERMLMRGRLADTISSKSRQQQEVEQNNTYIENKTGLIEDERSKEEYLNTDEYTEEDSIWGRRQKSLHKNSNIHHG